jgi:predicted dithiol-disulfide oxidoreductase (DUF899 family)
MSSIKGWSARAYLDPGRSGTAAERGDPLRDADHARLPWLTPLSLAASDRLIFERPAELKEAKINPPQVVTREQWLAARKELLAREQELTVMRDAVNAERHRLPMVRVEKDYIFDGPNGQVGLRGLFAGSRQLIVKHFMFDPVWDAGCPSCAASSGEISPGLLALLRQRDTAFAAVSRAPFAKIIKYKDWNGWDFPWYSSFGSEFNYDFQATLDEAVAPVVYNYQSKPEILAASSANDLVNADLPVEIPGLSCFLLYDGIVYHTYSTYSRGIEDVSAVRSFLALTALGDP